MPVAAVLRLCGLGKRGKVTPRINAAANEAGIGSLMVCAREPKFGESMVNDVFMNRNNA